MSGETAACGFPSSVSGRVCILPLGHPADSPERFHRFGLGAGGWLRNELRVLPMSERRREDLLALLENAEAEARAAAVAPLKKALRAVWLTSPVNCIPESLLIEIERLLDSATSPVREPVSKRVSTKRVSTKPVREPEGLDVERLAEAMAVHEWAWLGWTDRDRGHDDPRRMEAFRNAAAAIAAEYARLAPERPADEVDG